MSSTAVPDRGPALPASAFDFLPGNWNVAMRQRKIDGTLQVLGDWVPFDASATFERVLNGTAVFGKYELHKPDGTVPAVDFRFLDPATKTWTIYWAGANDHQWQDSPMRGGFATPDAMVFIMDDTLAGHAVLTRFVWRVPSNDHALWEQSFSNDRGKTWVANWTMDFTRAK